jgi:hypothetical protein
MLFILHYIGFGLFFLLVGAQKKHTHFEVLPVARRRILS